MDCSVTITETQLDATQYFNHTGNAPLLQVGFATAPWQGGLEDGELLGEVKACWGGLTRCWCAGCWQSGEQR